MTYKNLVDNLENIINAHNMIQTYGYGNLSDIEVPDNEEPPNYPYAFVNPVNTTNGRNNFNWTFNLIVMTQVNDGEDNEIAGQAECIQYIQDIVSVFTNTNTNPLLDIITPFDVTPFKERFQDNVVGATAVLTITYAKAIDGCDTPFSSLPTIPSASCPQVLVTDGDDTEHWINAGGSYTCLPATPKSGIFYQRVIPWDGYDYSGTEGSVEWHRKEGTYDYTPPSNPARIALLSDTYNGSDAGCLLQQTNIFSNNFRFTNDIGQQYVENFNQSASNNSSNKQLCLDHLTGLMIYVWNYTGENPLNLNWTASIDYANNFTYGGHSDWRMASLNEYIALFSNYITANAWGTMYAPWVDPDVRSFGGSFWLGSADVNDAGLAHTFVTNGTTISEISIISTRSYPFMVRNFYK